MDLQRVTTLWNLQRIEFTSISVENSRHSTCMDKFPGMEPVSIVILFQNITHQNFSSTHYVFTQTHSIQSVLD